MHIHIHIHIRELCIGSLLISLLHQMSWWWPSWCLGPCLPSRQHPYCCWHWPAGHTKLSPGFLLGVLVHLPQESYHGSRRPCHVRDKGTWLHCENRQYQKLEAKWLLVSHVLDCGLDIALALRNLISDRTDMQTWHCKSTAWHPARAPDRS